MAVPVTSHRSVGWGHILHTHTHRHTHTRSSWRQTGFIRFFWGIGGSFAPFLSRFCPVSVPFSEMLYPHWIHGGGRGRGGFFWNTSGGDLTGGLDQLLAFWIHLEAIRRLSWDFLGLVSGLFWGISWRDLLEGFSSTFANGSLRILWGLQSIGRRSPRLSWDSFGPFEDSWGISWRDSSTFVKGSKSPFLDPEDIS